MLDSILAARAGLQSTNDFNKYRKRASRKVRNLRRQLELVQRPQKGQGTPPKPLVAPEHYAVALWLAERAWSAGMEAKSALEATESPLLKRQVLSKLAKAHKYAREATELAADNGNDRLELLLYDTLVAADLAVQQKNWEAVVQLCSAARVGCDVMAKRTGQPLFGDVVTAKIDPALRFAAQRTGKVKTDVQRLAKSVTAASASSQTSPLAVELQRIDPTALQVDKVAPAEELGVIQWRRHEARVADADLAQAILTARAKAAALVATSPADYDDVLLAWQEASDAAHDLVATAESKNNTSDEQGQSLYIVATYIDYTVLVKRIERDLLIISGTGPTLTGLRDAVRIYDGILQSCGQLLELPGVYNDDELSGSLETLRAYFASRRCETIARGYAAVDNHAAALALVVRAQKLLSAASASLTVGELPVSAADVESWCAQLATLQTKRHGLAALLTGPAASTAQESFVSDDIGKHPVGTPESVLSRLANLKGTLQPVAVKPVVYDIAFNYIDAEDEENEEPAQPQGKKLFGLF